MVHRVGGADADDMTTNDTPSPNDAHSPNDTPRHADTIIDDGSARSEQTGAVPPPPPPPPPPRGRGWLRTPVARDPDNGKVGGVIAGVSRSYGFDLRTTRIAVAVATIVMPVLIAVYGAAWLLLPERPDEAAPLGDVVRDRRRLPLLIAIGIVVLAGGIGSFGSWFLFGGIPWGLGLIAIGVLLWAAPGIMDGRADRTDLRNDRAARRAERSDGRTARHGTDATTATSWGAPLPADAPRRDGWADIPPAPGFAGTDAATSATAATAAAGRWTLPPLVTAPRRRRYPVHGVGVIAAMTYVILAAGGDALGWWNVPILNGILITLAILWTTHALAGVVNRRWSVLPGLLFVGAVSTALLVTSPNLDGGVGTHEFRPVSVADAGIAHELGIGELTLDLTHVADAATRSTYAVRAEVGIGRLTVQVPSDVVLEIHSTLGAGHVVLDGDEIANGVHHEDIRTDAPRSAGTARPAAAPHTIVLDVEVGMGEIRIERSGVAQVAG